MGYGTTSYRYSKTIPDGAVDAKAYSADRVRKLLDSLQFKPAGNGGKKAFWMLFGTAKVNGKPFVWSEANPDWQKQKENPAVDFVPDKLEGAWNETSLFMD